MRPTQIDTSIDHSVVRTKSFEERLGAAIETACKSLPEGWGITLEIEKGSGTAMLFSPDGFDICGGEYEADDLPAEIENAVAYALADQQRPTDTRVPEGES